MIYTAPTLAAGGPSRVLVLKKWIKLLIQVTGPGTVYLGTSKDEAGRLQFGQIQDGLQLNNTNALRPWEVWWIDELWAATSDPNTQFVIVIPGLNATGDKETVCVSDQEMSFQD